MEDLQLASAAAPEGAKTEHDLHSDRPGANCTVADDQQGDVPERTEGDTGLGCSSQQDEPSDTADVVCAVGPQPVVLDMREAVWVRNMQFWLDRQIFHPNFCSFVWELVTNPVAEVRPEVLAHTFYDDEWVRSGSADMGGDVMLCDVLGEGEIP